MMKFDDDDEDEEDVICEGVTAVNPTPAACPWPPGNA
jgi:hypothetical protein